MSTYRQNHFVTGSIGSIGEQGDIGPKGEKGYTGNMSNVVGPKGEVGLPGDKGEHGERGPKGEQGDEGFVGNNHIGSKGPQGYRGEQGDIGPQGPYTNIIGPIGTRGYSNIGNTGTIGPTGIIGRKGNIGFDGYTGPIGNQGYPLISTEIFIEQFIGPQGAKGDKNNNIGHIGYIGAQGPDGVPGNTGDKGLYGFQGSYGNKGPKGLIGDKGSIGNKGIDSVDNSIPGPQGPQGPNGIHGIVGHPGPDGENGIPGNRGSLGINGTFGIQGSVGDSGPQGIHGLDGPQGSTGTHGVKGPSILYFYTLDVLDGSIGNDGPIGPIGPEGYKGNVGQQGHIGPQGNNGSQGNIGIIGIIGNQGPLGEKGNSTNFGPQGEIGPFGPNGILGPDGHKGLIGFGEIGNQGQPGPQGFIGPQGPDVNLSDTTDSITIHNSENLDESRTFKYNPDYKLMRPPNSWTADWRPPSVGLGLYDDGAEEKTYYEYKVDEEFSEEFWWLTTLRWIENGNTVTKKPFANLWVDNIYYTGGLHNVTGSSESVASHVSDSRLKYDEQPLEPEVCMDIVRNITPYKYKFKREHQMTDYIHGFMADNIEQVLPDATKRMPIELNIANAICEYEIDNSYLFMTIKNTNDSEFDISCIFFLIFTTLGYKSYSIKYKTSNYVTIASEELKEYLLCDVSNVRIKLNGIEYVTNMVYNKNHRDLITINISELAVPQDVSQIEIYGPVTHLNFNSPVLRKTVHEDLSFADYIVSIPNDAKTFVENNPKSILLWNKVYVLDAITINYNEIFTQYHGVLHYLDDEYKKLKNIYLKYIHELDLLKTKLFTIEKHLNI